MLVAGNHSAVISDPSLGALLLDRRSICRLRDIFNLSNGERAIFYIGKNNFVSRFAMIKVQTIFFDNYKNVFNLEHDFKNDSF